ncbi:MAG TPA: alpha/beta hydrolase [Mycobacteriales bacterium]
MITALRNPHSLVGTWRGRAALAAVAIVVTSTAVACTSSGTPSASAAGQSGIAWKSCKGLGNKFQCARVSVPLDWSQPNGKKIGLAVIRHLASRPSQRIGSMFINPGGPGQSGVGLVRNSGAELSNAWGAGRFNLVSWDPRGTNDSTPVKCFANTADRDRFWKGVTFPYTRAGSLLYQRKAIQLASRCEKLSGPLLSHISTADTARDLNRLRELVGGQKITYVGLSYGSFIGQIYANLFPTKVRAMMIDGIVDPVDSTMSMETNLRNALSSSDEVFGQLIAQCQKAGPKRCALAGHGETVAQRVAGLFTKVHRAPIPAPHANPPGVLSPTDLQAATFTQLRLPLTWPVLAKNLEAGVEGDASALKTAAKGTQSPAGMDADTASAVVSCADAPARVPLSAWPAQIARFNQAGELWGPLLGWGLWAQCAAFSRPHTADQYTGSWNAKTKIPIMVVGARYDPGTPYLNAVVAQHRLGNAVLITLNGFGHPSYQVPSKCLDAARVRYLVHLVPPRNGTVCQPDQSPFG